MVNSVNDDNSADPLARALLSALLADPESLRRLGQALADLDETEHEDRPPAYTVEGLAAKVAVSPRAVRNAITRGELRAVKRGNRWLIAQDAVDAWTHDAETKPPRRPVRERGAQARRRHPLQDALARLERA